MCSCHSSSSEFENVLYSFPRYKCFVRLTRTLTFYPAHFVIFSDELVGLLLLECEERFWTYKRVHQKFTPNILTNVESAV